METTTILCVDDDVTVLKSLRTLMGTFLGKGVEIEIAESGDEALEIQKYLMAHGKALAVVISDFIMPRMRGDELLIKIHEASPRTVKVMLTGQSDFDGIKRAINEANLYRFLEKPFVNADLVLTVKSALHAYSVEDEWMSRLEALQNENSALKQQLRELRGIPTR